MKTFKILGVFLDSHVCFSDMVPQVNATCPACYFKLNNLRIYAIFLYPDMKIMLVKCFVIFRLDYCNSLYSCIPQYLLEKLKKSFKCLY